MEKQNKSTHPLRFEELSDQAQEVAISNYEPFTDYDWYHGTIDSWLEDLEDKYGIEGRDVEFDDDFSPWFKAKVVDMEKFLTVIVPEAMAASKSPFHRIELGFEEDFWKDLWIEFSHFSGRNTSTRAMEVSIEDDEDVPEDILDDIQSRAIDPVVDELKRLGGMLRDDWEYMFSRQAAIDDFEANDTRFNPDGTEYED